MKEWEVTFVDQNGVQSSLLYNGDQRPSDEQAARLIRSHLFPVIDELDLNDFGTAVHSPPCAGSRSRAASPSPASKKDPERAALAL